LADEALVLAAQVVDQFSVPIQNMQRQLRLLVENNAKAHTQGAGLAKVHTEAYSKLLVSVRQTARVLQADFAPIVEKIGFAATSTGLAFGGLTASIAAVVGAGAGLGMMFQNNAQNLTRMHEATGLSIDALRMFEALGPKIGSSAEQMDAGLRSLTDRMDQMRRFPQAAAAGMQSAGFMPDLRKEVLALKDLKPEQELQGLLDIAERIRKTPGAHGGIRHEKEFLAFMGLPENFADYPGRIRELVAKTQEEIGHMTPAQVEAGNRAAEAWQGLQTRIGSISDFIGSTFIPMLNRGYDATAGFVVQVQTAVSKYQPIVEGYLNSAKTYFEQWRAAFAQTDLGTWLQQQAEKIKGIDWGGNADELGRTLGVSLRSNLADLKKDLTDFLNDPMVKDPFKGIDFSGVRASMPDWKGPLDDLKQLVKTGNEVITVIDDLAKGRVDWSLIFDLTGFKQMGDNFKAALEPGGFLHRFRELFDAINAHALGRSGNGPGRSPSGPAPAPFVLPNLDQFPKSETAPSGPRMPRPAFSPIAYRPDEDKPGGAMGGAAASKGDAISIIAQGVRRGTFDALTDFYERLKNMREQVRRAGVQNASYETGTDGSGAGAGGRGDESGGGTGRGRAGAGGPAGELGGALRRHGHGGGGSGGGQASGSELPPGSGGPLLDEISKSEGTRGYNDAFAHQHPGVDLSKLTINQVEALQRTQRGSPAIGRYQFMTKTLESLKKDLNLSGNEMFTPDTQERLARSLLQRRGYDQWKAGKLSDQAFMHNLSMEWAGLTDPYTGHGHYASIGQDTGHSLRQQFAALKAERDNKANTAIASMPARPVTPTPTATSSTLAKHGAELRKMFGERGPQRAPMVERPSLRGQQDVSLRPGDLHRREPGALLRAADQRQAAALKHEITGSASLHVKLAAGLAPVSGVKTKGDLFREIRLDRAPLSLASTTG
jgi:muramidase (phage lysozyme)